MGESSRKTLRLQEFDYSNHRAYFLTCCTKWRAYLFGEVRNGEMLLNAAGKMIDDQWRMLEALSPELKFDCHVVMPNHFHALVWLPEPDVAAAPVAADTDENIQKPFRRGEQNERIIKLMHEFKSKTTTEYIKGVKRGEFESFNVAVWQRTYYDHILRKSESVDKVRNYIRTNPHRWGEDMFHPNYKNSE